MLGISAAVGRLNALNGEPPARCRELSLAITNIEQGLLWLREVTEQLAEQSEAAMERAVVADMMRRS